MDAVPRLELLRSKRREIFEVLDSYGATNPRIVGSVARGDDRPESDIDLMLDMPEELSLLDVIGLERQLSDLLGSTVEVCEEDGLPAKVAGIMLAEAVIL